jgi:hypothetical protein
MVFKHRDRFFFTFNLYMVLGYGLDDRGVRVPAGAGNSSLRHRVHTGSGAHPASYPMDTRSSFLGSKAAGAWNWPLTSIQCRGQECVELYLHYPNTPSRRGAQLKKAQWQLTCTFLRFLTFIRCVELLGYFKLTEVRILIKTDPFIRRKLQEVIDFWRYYSWKTTDKAWDNILK